MKWYKMLTVNKVKWSTGIDNIYSENCNIFIVYIMLEEAFRTLSKI